MVDLRLWHCSDMPLHSENVCFLEEFGNDRLTSSALCVFRQLLESAFQVVEIVRHCRSPSRLTFFESVGFMLIGVYWK
jgi:hypothetical protein